MSDFKNSLLVKRQLPEFVRDDHPKFVSFMEAYYEFLDQTANAEAKDLRYLSDVDYSLAQFEQQFFNTFLPFLPRDAELSKETIIKNIMPMYLAKGSEKAYRLLFRMLFGEEIQIESPGRQVLRASDGRWSIENYIRVEESVFYTEYTGDGERVLFYLPYQIDKSSFTIYVDDVLVTNYEHRKETQKIIFNTAPANGSVIKIDYSDFDVSVFDNRKITGLTSGASAIIERVGRRRISGSSFYQFFVDQKTIAGTFANGELLTSDVLIDSTSVPIILQTYSDLLKITIQNGGSNYNIGDPVIVRGLATTPAIAEVERVATGTIDQLIVVDGGAGYQSGNQVLADGVSNTLFNASVSLVDTSGVTVQNTISYNIDIISDYASVNIGDADYGFPAAGVENVNSVIATALTSNTISNVGPIAFVAISTSQINSQINPNFYAISPLLYGSTRIVDLGLIGNIKVINGGTNYQVGEYLTFTNTPGSFSGHGANAVISAVSLSGAITQVKVLNGGLGYDANNLPTVSVSTVSGNGAVLQINSLSGKNVDFSYTSEEGALGEILSIKILDSGSGYTSEPGIDLTRYGDGTATAIANIRPSIVELPGRWTTSDSILSTDEIRLQGRDYYINYSYVIRSKVEFDKYKSILKNLLHPAGFINYAKYEIDNVIQTNVVSNVVSTIIRTVAGTVAITNNSNTIIGTNTQFVTANTLGILQTGNTIVVNNQTRTVVTINSNTAITVNNVFTTNANTQLIKINV